MRILDGFVGAIGNTPLIRLNDLCRETGCEILGKAEFLNPGGSVKDRAALYILRDADRRGRLDHLRLSLRATCGFPAKSTRANPVRLPTRSSSVYCASTV